MYYALFHGLAECCADEFIGRNLRGTPAWVRAYRALNHGQAAAACRTPEVRSFSIEVRNFAQLFVSLQNERHAADYDPASVPLKSDVQRRIADARTVLGRLGEASRRDRRRFAACVLFRARN